jgi:hypothetical protein
MRRLGALMLLAGCESILGLHPATHRVDGGTDVSDGAVGPDALARTDGAPGPDAARSPDARAFDAALPDAGPPPLPTDDFNASAISSQWAPYGAIAQTKGRLVSALAANAANSFAGVNLATAFSVAGRSVYVEVPTVPSSTAPSAFATLALDPAGDTSGDMEMIITEQGGNLLCETVISGTFTTIGMTTYDPTQHRFWMLSEATGKLSCETSPDGLAYSALGTPVSEWFDPTNVIVNLGTGTPSAETSPGNVEFDNLDLAPVLPPSLDFSSSTLPSSWSSFSNPPAATEAITGGQLQITLNMDSSTNYGGITTTSPYDLRGRTARVKVPQVVDTTQPNANQGLLLTAATSGTPNIQLTEGGGTLTCAFYDGTTFTPAGTAAYDPTKNVYWQLRELGGMVYCETSTDGTTFTSFGSMADPFPLQFGFVSVNAGTFGSLSANAGAAIFDDLVVLP